MSAGSSKSSLNRALLMSRFATINDPHIRSGFLVLVDLLKVIDDPVLADEVVSAFQKHVLRWEAEKRESASSGEGSAVSHRLN